MSDENKLTPEKIKQIQQLQQMIAMQQTGNQDVTTPKKWQRPTLKGTLTAILIWMQSSVKFVDEFTNFIVNKETKTSNNVLKTARSPIVFGFYVTLFCVVFGGIWAAVAPLDSAAVAIGTVISDSKRKSLNHQEGGIIKKVYVKLGDHVKEGDKLIELDDTRIKSEYENVLNQYRTYSATEARLLAEISNLDAIEFPEFLLNSKGDPEVSKIIETQNNLFKSKKELMRAERESLKQKTKQLHKQIEGLEAKKVSAKKNLEFIQDRLDATKKLTLKGYAQKSVELEYEVKEANAESEIAMTDTEIVKTEQEITKNEIDLINLDSKYTTQALSELRDVQVNTSGTREKFLERSDALEKSVIKSPVDGVVNLINFHTIGSYIPASQPIMEISPTNDSLVIEAKVDPRNIDAIRVGLISKIRFSAFKSRTTPLFTGKVVSLSPDIVIDQRQATDPKLVGGYYLAQIEIDMDEFNKIAKSRKLELHPGMQAEVQIITGTRTLLRYLLDPIFDAMFRGFKEK